MSTSVVFNGKKIKKAGVYSRIIGGISNPPVALDFGKICIIDTGSGAGFGFGSGINGELAEGMDAVYKDINDINDFRELVRGGVWWDLALPLFRPARAGVNGISSITFVRACTTASATLAFSPTGGGTAGGSLALKCRSEGVVGNGILTGGELTAGYGFIMSAGVVDPTKYMLAFYRGTYKGLDENGNPINGIPQADCVPELICVSDEFADMNGCVAWAEKDKTLASYFHIATKTVTGTGAITAADLTTYASMTVAAGGTETYNATDLDKVLDVIKEVDFTFFLCDQYGDDGADTENDKIFTHMVEEAKFDKFLVIGGGSIADDFDVSLATASYFNHERVIVPHGGVRKNNKNSAVGYYEYSSLYMAAYWLGRIAGLPPQVPVTNKGIDVDGLTHQLTDKQEVQALDNGVLVTKYDEDFRGFVCLQGISSILDNANLYTNGGRSYSIQIERIKSQINKEIIINGKLQLMGNPNGVNRHTLSERDVADWLDGYLKTRTATDVEDNLIIKYQNIKVVRKEDMYHTTYEFEPNSEITKLFFTGVIIG